MAGLVCEMAGGCDRAGDGGALGAGSSAQQAVGRGGVVVAEGPLPAAVCQPCAPRVSQARTALINLVAGCAARLFDSKYAQELAVCDSEVAVSARPAAQLVVWGHKLPTAKNIPQSFYVNKGECGVALKKFWKGCADSIKC